MNESNQTEEITEDTAQDTAQQISDEARVALLIRLREVESLALLLNPKYYEENFYSQFLSFENSDWINGNVWKDRLVMVTLGITNGEGVDVFSVRRNDPVESKNTEEMASILLDVFEQEKTAFEQSEVTQNLEQ